MRARRKYVLVLLTCISIQLFYLFQLSLNRPTKEIERTFDTRDSFVIFVKDKDGHTVLQKNVSNHWNKPLHLWDYKNTVLTHLHITKTGGTSLGHSLRHSKLKNGCKVQCFKKNIDEVQKKPRECPGVLGSFCGTHFDWSFVQKIEDAGLKTAPIVVLRRPVSRVISEYYFSQKTERNTGHKFLKQNISVFLNDLDSMMESNHIWHDGHVSYTSWSI